MTRCSLYLSLIVVFIGLGFGACTDDTEPRDGTGGGPSSPGTTSPGDDDATVTDVDDDAQHDVDDTGEFCDLEPSNQPADPRYPCCYDHEDCRDSNVTGAESMYCYYAVCTDDGQGVCRTPPSQQMQCWDDYDCPIGYSCTIDDLACDQPTLHESPGTCVEDDD